MIRAFDDNRKKKAEERKKKRSGRDPVFQQFLFELRRQ